MTALFLFTSAVAALLCLGDKLPLNAVRAENMNGLYQLANAPLYSTLYSSEFFDVYSPEIRTRYSEVYWRMQDPVPLPAYIQDRFNQSIIAIVGYEVDQVRKTPSGDVSVPITWAYNHHYCAWLSGKKTKLVKSKGANPELNHGSNERWIPFVENDSDPTSDIPLNQFFSEGNGGEFRKSYHGYPKGYAQLLESPDTFHISPMQIDTWNRTMASPKYEPGPLPKNSRVPAKAGYSGLVECPCSDRIKNEWNMTYALETSNSACEAPVQNSSECFGAARQVVPAEHYSEKTVNDDARPSGCVVEPHGDGSIDIIWNSAKQEAGWRNVIWNDLPRVVAYSHGIVNMKVDLTSQGATITLIGPSDVWLGVGFGSNTMCLHMESDQCADGGPYAIIVLGDAVEERKLDFHGPGTTLDPSIQIVSNEVARDMRKVILVRSLEGLTSDYYTFVLAAVSVPIITAKGCGLTFSQHCGHEPSELNFLPEDQPTGICQTGIVGTIGGNKFDNSRCKAFPRSDLVDQHNPTCSVQTYRGGLMCCRDGQSLLDKEQDIPWEEELVYHLKFRFYFEEYRAASDAAQAPSHKNLVRLFWATDAGEYDIVQCKQGTPPSQCVQVLTSRVKLRDIMHDCSTRPDGSGCTGKGSTNSDITQGIELIYAGPHCHAPTCLSFELYNADTGQLLCRMEPDRGQSDELYDEHGFLAIPPCLWGDEAQGLPPPELLSLDTTLLSIKRNNNTLGHTGEMALWQMRGVVVPKLEKSALATEAKSTRIASETGLIRRRGSLR